ncbi:uncharacterized protein LOC110420760 [Herrania umbratica]|uniref:Uncharacterized protein LOC110420760 n=1 Tax=Herrania umbratica TaxID=108875 RepID=A0A6J1AS63_9ROSI|nr:uncharacterized protein LOC110420760 [Herrania umbratica]
MYNDITSIVQLDFETLYKAWDNYKDLLRRSPHHGLAKWLQIQTFCNGLVGLIRITIDVATRGALMSKSIDEAYDLLEEIASNNYQWPSKRLGATLKAQSHDDPYQSGIAKVAYEVVLSKVMWLRLPQFLRFDATKDAQKFLDKMTMIYNAFSCTSTKSVQFAIFKLDKVARWWYKMLCCDKATDATLMSWEEFSTMFLECLLPNSIRKAKGHEFETLLYTVNMLVVEYNVTPYKFPNYSKAVNCSQKFKLKDMKGQLNEPKLKRAKIGGCRGHRDSLSR